MSAIGWLLLVWAIMFATNGVPAFMSLSRSVIALFRGSAGLPLLPLSAGGAGADAQGGTGTSSASSHPAPAGSARKS